MRRRANSPACGLSLPFASALVPWAVALGLALAAPAARAQPPAPVTPPAESGKVHFEHGVKEYNLGRFQEAIGEFEKAYDLDPAPILLFNIAQSHRQLGNKERALFFYRRYLEQEPEAAKRSEVEQRMKDLAQSLEQEKDLKQKPPTEVERADATKVTPPPPPPGTSGTPDATVSTGGTTQTTTAGGAPPPNHWAVAACLAPSFATVSGVAVDLPVLFALRVGGSYAFPMGPNARIVAGADGTLAVLPYSTDANPPAKSNSTLPGFLLSGRFMYDVLPWLSAGGGVGAGVLWWSGLGDGNPFDVVTTGSIPMPTFEVQARGEASVTRELFVVLAPSLLYSKATSGLGAAVSGMWRFDVNVGAGYRF
jgi:hypothetical protein